MPTLCRGGGAIEADCQTCTCAAAAASSSRRSVDLRLCPADQPILKARARLIAFSRFDQRHELLMTVLLVGIPEG